MTVSYYTEVAKPNPPYSEQLIHVMLAIISVVVDTHCRTLQSKHMQ